APAREVTRCRRPGPALLAAAWSADLPAVHGEGPRGAPGAVRARRESRSARRLKRSEPPRKAAPASRPRSRRRPGKADEKGVNERSFSSKSPPTEDDPCRVTTS